jgi:2-dehydropantoate 2-reductase
MKICIYGAGAIGGYLGAGLALNGADVTLIARGPHLAAMQKNGLKLIKDGEERTARVTATGDPSEAGPQDYVIITLKAHSVPPIADRFAPLFHDETAVVWGVNGIPWWYFYGLDGDYTDRRVECLDPGGVLWENLGPERMIGCAVYPAAEVTEPGVIQHVEGDRFSLGEPSGEKTDRIQALSAALIEAGFKAPVRPQIRNELWVKLWGNLSFNPISALTHATLETIGTDPGTREIARRMMLEGQAIGEALGTRFAVDVEKRINGAVAVGAHKTSMLQDLERGRPMEIDALVTAVQEMGRMVEVKTPYIDAVLALVRQRAREAGCYDG